MDYESLKRSELNTLIERVVLKLPETCHGRVRFHGSADEPDDCWCEGCAAEGDFNSLSAPHPRVACDYACSIALAWEVIEKLYPRFGIQPYDSCLWVCHDGGGDINRAKITAFASTAPLAVCIAALKAADATERVEFL